MAASEMENYINSMIADGYIKRNGTPLKCLNCGSTDLKYKDYNGPVGVEETKVTCNNCGSDVGYWAYGNWLV